MSSLPYQNMGKRKPDSPKDSSPLSVKRENFERIWMTQLPHSAERLNVAQSQPRSSLPSLLDVDNFTKYEAKRNYSQKLINKNQSMPNNSKGDKDILILMTKRLQEVECQNRNSKVKLQDACCIIEQKDKTIKQLQNKLAKKEASESTGNEKQRLLMPTASKCWVERAERDELLQRCAFLEKQLEEMNDFFADYGLTFVGDKSTCHADTAQPEQTSPMFDFSKLVNCIDELNLYAREGESRIVSTNQGATFRTPDSVPLVLYANGLILFSGPFRDYTDPSTQAFLQDIMDGFFPTELQRAYPDGVPFKVVDKREKIFHDQRLRCKVFGGTGRRLGHRVNPHQPLKVDQDIQKDFEKPSEDSGTKSNTRECEVISSLFGTPRKSASVANDPDPRSVKLSGESLSFQSSDECLTRRCHSEWRRNDGDVHKKRITSDEFLKKLPSVVVRNGNLVSIRDNLSEIFKISAATEPSIVEINTDKDQSEKQITLKIRSRDGNIIYKVSVSPTMSVKELRELLDSVITDQSKSYEIVYRQASRFISLRHSNHSLSDYDITHNSVLVMLTKPPAEYN